MFKTNVSEYNTIWGAQKYFRGALLPNAPPWLRVCFEVFARAIEGSYPDFSVFSTANKSLLAYIVFQIDRPT